MNELKQRSLEIFFGFLFIALMQVGIRFSIPLLVWLGGCVAGAGAVALFIVRDVRNLKNFIDLHESFEKNLFSDQNQNGSERNQDKRKELNVTGRISNLAEKRVSLAYMIDICSRLWIIAYAICGILGTTEITIATALYLNVLMISLTVLMQWSVIITMLIGPIWSIIQSTSWLPEKFKNASDLFYIIFCGVVAGALVIALIFCFVFMNQIDTALSVLNGLQSCFLILMPVAQYLLSRFMAQSKQAQQRQEHTNSFVSFEEHGVQEKKSSKKTNISAFSWTLVGILVLLWTLGLLQKVHLFYALTFLENLLSLVDSQWVVCLTVLIVRAHVFSPIDEKQEKDPSLMKVTFQESFKTSFSNNQDKERLYQESFKDNAELLEKPYQKHN